MTALTPLEFIHKKGLFGDHHKQYEKDMLKISELNNLTIVQVVKYIKSKVQINSSKIDGLELPLENSKIKAKQESPGAKDGIKSLALLPLSELGSTPIIFNNNGVTAKSITLKANANNGNNTRLPSILTFNKAIKIVAGNASVRIIFFNPLVSSPTEIFFFKMIPIIIKRINEIDFSTAPSIY